jgi:hypothetical protein
VFWTEYTSLRLVKSASEPPGCALARHERQRGSCPGGRRAATGMTGAECCAARRARTSPSRSHPYRYLGVTAWRAQPVLAVITRRLRAGDGYLWSVPAIGATPGAAAPPSRRPPRRCMRTCTASPRRSAWPRGCEWRGVND